MAWYQVVSGGNRWYQVVTGGIRWYQVVSGRGADIKDVVVDLLDNQRRDWMPYDVMLVGGGEGRSG